VFIGLPALCQSMLVTLNASQSSTCIPGSHQPAFQLLQHHLWLPSMLGIAQECSYACPPCARGSYSTSYTSQSSTCISCSHQPAFQLLLHYLWASTDARNSSGVFIGLPGLCPSQLVTSYTSQFSTCISCSHQPAFQLLLHYLWASINARNKSGAFIGLPVLRPSQLVPLDPAQPSTCVPSALLVGFKVAQQCSRRPLKAARVCKVYHVLDA
jgi:hypothetical protein